MNSNLEYVYPAKAFNTVIPYLEIVHLAEAKFPMTIYNLEFVYLDKTFNNTLPWDHIFFCMVSLYILLKPLIIPYLEIVYLAEAY